MWVQLSPASVYTKMGYKFANIIKGHTNYLLGINRSISETRKDQACSRCVMAHEGQKYVGTCRISIGGCGCGINAKTSVSDEACPLYVWANDWIKPEMVDVINKAHKFVKSEH